MCARYVHYHFQTIGKQVSFFILCPTRSAHTKIVENIPDFIDKENYLSGSEQLLFFTRILNCIIEFEYNSTLGHSWQTMSVNFNLNSSFIKLMPF